VVVATAAVASAQKPVTQTDAVEVTAKIEAIDHTTSAWSRSRTKTAPRRRSTRGRT
jgi:hypothetical protein